MVQKNPKGCAEPLVESLVAALPERFSWFFHINPSPEEVGFAADWEGAGADRNSRAGCLAGFYFAAFFSSCSRFWLRSRPSRTVGYGMFPLSPFHNARLYASVSSLSSSVKSCPSMALLQ